MSDTLGSTTRPGRAVRELLATASSPRRMAIAIVLVFGVSSVVALAQPSSALGWDAGSFSSSSESALVTPDQPRPRQRRAPLAQGRLDG